MNFNFFEELKNAIQKTIGEEHEKEKININNIGNDEITQNEINLAQKLDAIQEFSIDRIEGNKVVLENRETGQIVNVEKNQIPNHCVESAILKCINGKYFYDEKQTLEEKEQIKNEYNNLWK